MSQQALDRFSAAVLAEVPAERIGPLLKKFEMAAKDGNCGGGCGGGCCGAACATADGLNVDRFGHSGIDSKVLNAIGIDELDQLRQSIRSGLTQKANAL